MGEERRRWDLTRRRSAATGSANTGKAAVMNSGEKFGSLTASPELIACFFDEKWLRTRGRD